VLRGGGGNDTLNGGDGSDAVRETDAGDFTLANTSLASAVSGNDSLIGMERASLSGTAGDDSLTTGSFTGPVTLDGGGGDDSLRGGPSSDSLAGGAGNDSMDGGAGNDSLSGGEGSNTLAGNTGTDRVVEQDDVGFTLENSSVLSSLGTDSLTGIEQASLTGGAGNDTFTVSGWTGSATLNGGAGNDTVEAAGNVNFTLTNTLLTRSAGGSFALAGVESASLTGGAGNNIVNAAAFTAGGVTLIGDAGNDTLLGGGGADLLDGGIGSDSLNAGLGDDSMNGGAGNDTYAERLGSADVITDTDGHDRLDFTSATAGVTLDLASGSAQDGAGNTVAIHGDFESVIGSNFADSLTGTSNAESISGNGGNDTLTGLGGNDTLNGGSGTDVIAESGGADFSLTNAALTGAGNDSLSGIERALLANTDSAGHALNASLFTLGSVTLIGGAGDDTLRGGSGGDWLTGGLGNDSIAGGSGTDRLVEAGIADLSLTNSSMLGLGTDALAGIEQAFLQGTGGDDSLNASGFTAGPVTLDGGNGNDRLRGGGGSDSLLGGEDNDTLDGGLGNDALSGGNGNDYLFGNDGSDTLNGDAGDDVLIDWSGTNLRVGGTGVNVIITVKTDPLLPGIMPVHFSWVAFP
jgi:Ca2+-binding RTX toxin-like protein